VAWGYNAGGQCSPPAPNTGFAAIAAGHSHSVALRPDGDWDAVPDVQDDCPGTAPNVPVDVHGCPAAVPGDLDHDGVVSIADFASFAACAPGPEVSMPPDCGSADLDGDSDVDLGDFAIFQGCWLPTER